MPHTTSSRSSRTTRASALRAVPIIQVSRVQPVFSRRVKKVDDRFIPVGKSELTGVNAVQRSSTRERFFSRPKDLTVKGLKEAGGKFKFRGRTFVG